MSKIFVSVILPVTDPRENINALLDQLWRQQPADFETLLVSSTPMQFSVPDSAMAVRQITSRERARGAMLNAGAAEAAGKVLLFLWPGNQLPVEAILTIERNLLLLPQTIGGNFHVAFDDRSFAAERATRFVKEERYKGHYFGNSGIFVRKPVFETLGGFQPLHILEDFEFGRRLEAHGPTLYLPDKIITSFQPCRAAKMSMTARWLLVSMLLKFGVGPARLDSFAAN